MLGPLEYSFGASFRLSVTLAVALAVVFTVLARHHRRPFKVGFGDWFLASAFASVVAFTQYAPYDGRGRPVDLTPFDTIWRALHGRGDTLIVANLALFIPVGMALALHRWGRGSTLLASAVLAIGAEVMQFATGNGRVAQVDDVIVNTFGAFIGWVLLHVLRGRPTHRPSGSASSSSSSSTASASANRSQERGAGAANL